VAQLSFLRQDFLFFHQSVPGAGLLGECAGCQGFFEQGLDHGRHQSLCIDRNPRGESCRLLSALSAPMSTRSGGSSFTFGLLTQHIAPGAAPRSRIPVRWCPQRKHEPGQLVVSGMEVDAEAGHVAVLLKLELADATQRQSIVFMPHICGSIKCKIPVRC
jgi:hypothetical protein